MKGEKMIKLFTAFTRDADNSAEAVKEIKNQLNLEENQLAHSAALIFCHIEFIESGIAAAICKALPFDTLGCTAQYFALRKEADEIMLTAALLTSDDIEFAAGVS